MSFIGFQSTIPSALEDSRILRFDIAVLNGILDLGMNVPIIFTTQDDSAQGNAYFIPSIVYYTLILSSLAIAKSYTIIAIDTTGIIEGFYTI